ncbi:MAG: hypothetical protein ABSD20_16110 [Terriglobales bacterium]|jgi:hypothetical protein
MNKVPEDILALPLEVRALMAMQAAVEGVIEENARLGLPLYIRENGKMVAKDAQEILDRRAAERAAEKERATELAPAE